MMLPPNTSELPSTPTADMRSEVMKLPLFPKYQSQETCRHLQAEGAWAEKMKREEGMLIMLCKLFGGSSLALAAKDDPTANSKWSVCKYSILPSQPGSQTFGALCQGSSHNRHNHNKLYYNWKPWYNSLRWVISAFENGQGKEIHLSPYTLLKSDSKSNVGDLT